MTLASDVVAVAPIRHARPSNPDLMTLAVVLPFWLIIVFRFFLGDASPIAGGRLFDTDDYMRFVEVFHWLDGAGWSDLVEPRLNPPAGVAMHWSRLVDVPLALIILLAEPWSGRVGAAMVAATVVPALLMLALFLVSGWAARPLLSRGRMVFATLFPAFLGPALVQFAPGRVDHHAWQLLAGLALMGLLARIAVRPADRRPAIVAALIIAPALWVGGEVLPWFGLFGAGLAGLWIARGGPLLGTALTFAGTLAAACAVLLPAVRPPGAWMAVACDGFSLYYASFGPLALLFWAGVWRLGRDAVSVPGRLAAAAGPAVVVVALLWLLFPECRGGPFAQVHPRVMELWFGHVSEVMTVFQLLADNPAWTGVWLLNPVTAVGLVAWRVVRTRGRARRVWLVYGLFLLPSLVLASWAIRGMSATHLFAAVPLAWLVAASWRAVERRWTGWRRLAGKIGSLLAISPLPAILVVALAAGAPPDDKTAAKCNIRAVSETLADPAGLGARSRLIASMIDFGPELLFRTPHAVVAAPYHRNTGIIDNYDLLSARDDAAARALTDRLGIDLILLCPEKAEMRLYQGGKDAPTLADRLAADEAPSWLRPMETPAGSGVRLFEVSR